MIDTWNAAQLNEAAGNGSIGGGGSSLPSVTGSDNGKVLGVVEGAWGKMDAPKATKTVLYNPETPTSVTSSASEVELNAVITGYDYILVTLGNNPERSIAVSTPEDLESTDGCSFSSGSSEEWQYSVGADHKTLTIKCGGSNRKLHKVVGIKL